MGMAKKNPISKAQQKDKITKASKEKKKWTSVKTQESAQKLITLKSELFEKIKKEIQTMKVVTKNSLSEKYNLSLYLAIRLLRMFEEEKLVTFLKGDRTLKIYRGCKVEFKPVVIEKEVEQVEDGGDWGND